MIRVEDLTKEFVRAKRQEGRFGAVRSLFTRQVEKTLAVESVSFEVGGGEMVGYLGPNGAGKSTTIKMMTGILEPTSGVVEVGGIVPWKDRRRNALQIGVVFGQRTQLWWDLPLRDSLDVIATLYRMPTDLYKERLDQFVEMLEMAEFLNRPVRQLSLGQRMRGDLAAAMIYQPRILYLDEPTVGLDVVAKATMRDFISQVNREQGTTVILTTHDIADVERLCPRVILIDHGRVLYDGTVSELKQKYAPHRVLVVTLAGESSAEFGINPDHLRDWGAEPVTDSEESAGSIRLRFEGGRTAASDLISNLAEHYPIADVSIEEPDLEGVVRTIYRRQGMPT